MTTFEQYWNGDVCATITRDQIPSGLLSNFYHNDWSIDRWNLAFRLFYDGRQAIKAFRDANPYDDTCMANASDVSREQNRVVPLMTADLVAAAQTGWSLRHPGDLEAGFRHLADNNGAWTDEKYGYYSGPLGELSSMRRCATAYCAAQFLEAYEQRIMDVKKALEQMRTKASRIETIGQQVERANTVGTKEWTDLGTTMREVQQKCGLVERCLWLFRLCADPHSRTADALALGENGLQAAAQCLSAIALIRNSVSAYNDALTRGLTPTQAAGHFAYVTGFGSVGVVAGFVEGAGAVAGGMMTLLGVYVAALQTVPAIYQFFTGVVQERNMWAARAGVDLAFR